MAGNKIKQIAIRDLKPWARNARTHSKKQFRQIGDSIEAFGFTNPVLIDEQRKILAGHGRVAGAKLLGMSEVPCLRLDHMSEDEKQAYVLEDNKLALNAGWDEELLAAEQGALMAADPEDDLVPDLAPARVQPGDIWQLGHHRLVCGDALDANVIATLMDSAEARMVFSDPPYNVQIDGHVGNSGTIQHSEFAMASGEMSQSKFTAFLEAAFRKLADHSVNGSIHYLCMDWRHMSEMLEAGQGSMKR